MRSGRLLRRSGSTSAFGEGPMPGAPRMCSMRYSRSEATSRCWMPAERGGLGVAGGCETNKQVQARRKRLAQAALERCPLLSAPR